MTAQIPGTLFDDFTPPKPRDMTVSPVESRQVRDFCEALHYTGTAGAANWSWGLWHGLTLWGVISYNLPTHQICENMFGPEHGADHVWHMGRLAVRDEGPRNSESRLIAGSMKDITRTHPHVWAIVTYAAQDAGHIGYVYQATNALYCGEGGDPAIYIDQDGKQRPTWGGRPGKYISATEATRRGWTVTRGLPKHRYLYILGNRTERKQRRRMLRWPVHPDYPKTNGGTP